MAKKAKAAKAAKKTMVTPTYLQGTKPVDIPLHRVAEVLSMIHDQGHIAKFKRQAKAAGVVMALDPKTVNFVKDFVARNQMHTHAVGRSVVNSDGTFSCT
jgi:hypothetical protein